MVLKIPLPNSTSPAPRASNSVIPMLIVVVVVVAAAVLVWLVPPFGR